LRCPPPAILEDADNRLLALALEVFTDLLAQLQQLDSRLTAYDQRVWRLANQMPEAKRLMGAHGVGPLIATALIAKVADARLFDNSRQFAVWVGLVPHQYAGSDKARQGGKHGSRRSLSAQTARSRRALDHVPIEGENPPQEPIGCCGWGATRLQQGHCCAGGKAGQNPLGIGGPRSQVAGVCLSHRISEH
jgi:hypothetical protein